MGAQTDDQRELTFLDLIADPLIRKLMEADGVGDGQLFELVGRARKQQRRGRGADLVTGSRLLLAELAVPTFDPVVTRYALFLIKRALCSMGRNRAHG